MIGWCGKGQRKSSSKRKEKWEEALLYTEKRLVQSVRNLHCTGAVGDEFGKDFRCSDPKDSGRPRGIVKLSDIT